MAVAAAKQSKAPQKAVKWTAADRRKMLGLKVDRKLCRRMSKMWQRREKGWSKTISRVVQDSLTNVTRVVLTTEIELLRVVVVGLMEKRLVLAAAEKKSSTTERVELKKKREAWLMQRGVVRED